MPTPSPPQPSLLNGNGLRLWIERIVVTIAAASVGWGLNALTHSGNDTIHLTPDEKAEITRLPVKLDGLIATEAEHHRTIQKSLDELKAEVRRKHP